MGRVDDTSGSATADPAIMRPATSADLPAIAAIYAHYVRETVITFDEQPRTAADWARRLAERDQAGWPFLVAESAGEVVGYAYVAPFRDRPAYRFTVEDSVYLRPDAVGQGIGTALLDRLITRAATAGGREIIAMISDTGNPASVELHSRVGFRLVGTLTRAGFKHERWIDVVIMQRSVS